MTIAFNCPSCSQLYHVPESLAGRKSKCKKCGAAMEIPRLDSAAAAPEPEAEEPTVPEDRPVSAPQPKAIGPKPIGVPPAEAPILGELVEEEEESADTEEAALRKKRKSGLRSMNLVVMAGGAAAVLVCVGLGIVAFMWLFSGSSSDAVKYLPDNCQLIAAVNVEEMVSSELYRQLKQEVPELEKNSMNPESEMGISLDNIAQMITGGSVATAEPLVIIKTKSSISAQDILAARKNKEQIKAVTVGRYTLHEDSGTLSFCVADSKTVLFGNTAALRKVLERDRQPEQSEAMNAALRTVNLGRGVAFAVDVKQVAGVAGGLTKGAGPAQDPLGMNKMMDGVLASAIQISFSSYTLEASTTVVCKDSKSAEDLKKAVEGMATLLKQRPMLPNEVTEMMDALKLSVSGSNITGTASIKNASIVKQVKGFAGLPGFAAFKPVGAPLTTGGNKPPRTSSSDPIVINPDKTPVNVIEPTGKPPSFWVDALRDPARADQARKALASLGPDALPDLRKALKDANPMVRGGAVVALGDIGARAQAAVPELIGLLKDKDVAVRSAAAVALGKMGADAKGAFPALLEVVGDSNNDVAQAATAALEKIGPLAAADLPALGAALKSNRAEIRLFVAGALAKVGSDGKREAVRMLLGLLQDEEKAVRDTAQQALKARTWEADDILLLTNVLKEDNPPGRLFAIGALAQMGTRVRGVVPDLAAALKDEDVEVARAAAAALEALGTDATAAVPRLMQALKSNDKQLRERTYRALAGIGPEAKEAVPVLTYALQNDPDKEIRKNAAQALARIGPSSDAVGALLQALKDPDPELAGAAAEALGRAGPLKKDQVPTLMAALSSDQPKARAFAMAALGEIGPGAQPAVPALIELLKSPEPATQQQALQALAKIGPKDFKAAEPIGKLFLKSKDDEQRKLAGAVLRAMGPSAWPAVKDVAAGLKDKASSSEAMGVLLKIGKSAVPELLSALSAAKAPERVALIEVLGELGPEAKEAVGPLTALVKGDDFPRVRKAAESALKKIQAK